MELWRLFEEVFISVTRQDDIFTRRSILKVITLWTTRRKFDGILYLPNEKDLSVSDTQSFRINGDNSEKVRKLLINIFHNGSLDFDWEVRKLAIGLWTNAVAVFPTNDEYFTEWEAFVNLLIDSTVAIKICESVCDCEYEVTSEALKCLQAIRNMYVNKTNQPIKINDSVIRPISSSDDVEDFLKAHKTFDQNAFRTFFV